MLVFGWVKHDVDAAQHHQRCPSLVARLVAAQRAMLHAREDVVVGEAIQVL